MRIWTPLLMTAVMVSATLLSGCAHQYVRGEDMEKMRAQMSELQQSMAHLNLRMEELNNSVMILQETTKANRDSIRGMQSDIQKPSIYISDSPPPASAVPGMPLPQGGDTRWAPSVVPHSGISTTGAQNLSPAPAQATGSGLDAALSQFQSGNYGLAAYDLAAFLAASPRSAEAVKARYHLAESYFQLGDYAQASREFGLVLSQGGGSFSAKATLRSAQCFQAQGLTAQSEEMFKRVVAQYPGTPEARIAAQELAP